MGNFYWDDDLNRVMPDAAKQTAAQAEQLQKGAMTFDSLKMPKTDSMLKNFFIQALMQGPMGLRPGGVMGGPITGGTAPGKGFPGHYQYKGMPLEGSAENLAQMHGEIVPANNPSPLSSRQQIITPSWAHNLNKTNQQLHNEAIVRQLFKEPKTDIVSKNKRGIQENYNNIAGEPFDSSLAKNELSTKPGIVDAKQPLGKMYPADMYGTLPEANLNPGWRHPEMPDPFYGPNIAKGDKFDATWIQQQLRQKGHDPSKMTYDQMLAAMYGEEPK